MTVARKVAVLIASHDTQAGLKAWAEASGFDLATDYDGNPREADRFDFHVTLLASSNEVGTPETQHMIRPVGVDGAGFGVLGVESEAPGVERTKLLAVADVAVAVIRREIALIGHTLTLSMRTGPCRLCDGEQCHARSP